MPVPGSQRPAEPALPPQPLQATKQEAGKENRDASARPAATGGKPAARGLTWRGCWGCSSSEIGIYVLATMVGHIHLQALGEGNDAEYKAALQDVRRLLQESLPASAVLANVNWAKACPQASGRMAEVAIVGTSTACQRLQSQWKGKKLCGGLVTAIWTSLNDTASEKHVERMAEMANKELKGLRRRTLALELPARWVEGQAPKQVNQLGASSQWYRFCALFGEVQTLELVRPMGAQSTVQLLISYKEPEFAGAFREALTDRYLIFVNSSIPDDCYPVCCVPGDGYSLREYFCSGASREKKPSATRDTRDTRDTAPAAAAAASLGTQTPKAPAPAPGRTEVAMSTTGGFLLRRCGRGEVPGALRPAPETFPINKHRVDFGREDTCDVVLRHQHVSKVHAVFVLQTLPEGAGDMLLMQDNSSNGTWINGQRMTQGRFHQLQPGDRISFLQPSSTLEEDVATWEVRRDPSVVVSAASPPAPGPPAGVPVVPARAPGAPGAPGAPAPKEAPKKKAVEEPSRAEQAKVPAQDLKPASKTKKPGSAVEAVPAARPPTRATVPPVAPASPPPDPPEPPPEPRPKTAKRKAAAAPPVAPKPMPVKRPAPAPEAMEPPQKVRAAAKTQGKKPSRISKPTDESHATLQQELAAGYAALAAAAAQAQAEEADEAEAEVPEPPAEPDAHAAFPPSAQAALAGYPAWKSSPPWRSTSMQMPPPPKSSPVEASPAMAGMASAAQAAWQVLSQMRLIRPKARPGSNGYSTGAPRITPYLDMPRSATPPPPPPPKTSEEVADGLASNDISAWARAWKLESYEAILLRNYDDVDQIVCLHCDDLWLFFKDNNVYDEADQWAFTHAIQGRQAFTS